MNKIYTLLMTLLLSTAFFSISHAEEVWKITSLDWQPYSGAEMATQGNSVQKLRALLKKEGIELVVEFYPWARAQALAKREGYLGYFPAWPEEVGEGFVPSPPIDVSEVAVLTYEDSDLTWAGLDALFKSQKVGLIKTYVYSANIQKLARENRATVDLTPNETSLLKKLSVKRINAAITDPAVMQYLANRHGIGNIKVLATLEEKPLLIAFKKSPDTQRRIDFLKRLLQ